MPLPSASARRAAAPLDHAPTEPFFRAIYARLLCVELQARGIDPAPLLADIGVQQNALAGVASWLSVPQFLRLCAAARAACPDPLLPLDWGRRLTDSVHGLVGVAVTSAPDVRAALSALHQVSVLRSTTIRTALHGDAEGMRLSYAMLLPLGELNEFIHAPLAMMITQVLGVVLAEATATLTIELPFARPAWAADAHRYYPCALRFGAAQLCFCVPAPLLARANAMADPVAHTAALRQCELDRLGLEQNLLARLTAYLAAQAERAPGAEEVAEVFCLSPRSLRRALADEGRSYRQLLSEARMAAACRYLDETPLSVEQLAWRLSYADTSNFIRAFRQARGMTPEQYRRRTTG